MTDEEKIEAIVEGRDWRCIEIHYLVAWKFRLEHKRDPSLDEMRTYLREGKGYFHNFWKQGMAQHG